MKYFHYFLFTWLVGWLPLQALPQDDAEMLLKQVNAKMNQVQDYTVQAHITVDMPFIRILPVKVKIFYKQKDKFKVESESIAVVPRQSFDQLPRFLAGEGSVTAMIQGREKIGEVMTSIVTVIPMSDTSDVILGKFWVNPAESLILKSQLTTRSSGTIITEYFYSSQAAFGLPDRMVFTVDMSRFRMPKTFASEIAKEEGKADEADKKNKKGQIFIELSNYQVNKGIADSVFD
jgi:hypothetical protein